MEKTDEQLMHDYQSGKNEALAMIFERYKISITNFCLRLLANRADAEEAAGDCFLALLDTHYAYTPEAKFSTWLYTIARNKCISQIRKRRNLISLWFTSEESADTDSWAVPDTRDLSRDELIQKETNAAVSLALTKLPYEQREAIVLSQYNGFSYREISEILNCSVDKVKILLFRAKERLRVELASFVKEDIR